MWKIIAVAGFIGSPAAANIYKCSEWSDAGLRHKGNVIVSVTGTNLRWQSDTHEASAELVSSASGVAVFAGENYIYFAFGYFSNAAPSNWLDTVRRVAMSRNSDIGEITCAH